MDEQVKILVIDDDQDISEVLTRLLTQWGHDVCAAQNGADARKALRTVVPDVVLLDVGLPDVSGLDLLIDVKEARPDCSVIMMTADGTTRSAVTAMKRGAEDYLNKPIDFEELKIVLEKARERTALKKEVALLRARQREQYSRDYVFLNHPKMREVYDHLEQVADTDSVTVLIRGETGTGKEHVARLIHQYSPRNAAPFVELHCAALPETLLESELFGYEAGAFTDARRAKAGLFEQAQGGTLFLDEIGELPLSMQTKLLKVLEDHTLRRLGSLKSTQMDVRLIAATNRDLGVEVKEGRFRADLFYRLNVFMLELPPLRDRVDDVRVLAQFFTERFSETLGRRTQPLGQNIIRHLMAYPWPGNVRELKNTMERLVIRAGREGKPKVEDLPPEIIGGVLAQESPLAGGPPDPEREKLAQVLQDTRWNKSKAAVLMGVSRPTLLKMIKRHGLQ